MALKPYKLCLTVRVGHVAAQVVAHITSHHITSHHITSHHITSHHITSHHITSHHITSHHITSHHITSHHITSHHITSHHITSHHTTSQCLQMSSVPCFTNNIVPVHQVRPHFVNGMSIFMPGTNDPHS